MSQYAPIVMSLVSISLSGLYIGLAIHRLAKAIEYFLSEERDD